MPDKCLPDSLKGKPHDDWKMGPIKILTWVPRSWTAWCGWAFPQPPWKIFGSAGWREDDWPSVEINGETYHFGHHDQKFFNEIRKVLPIPRPGHALLSAVLWLKVLPLPMFAITYRNGDYFSVGIFRWDDIDKYYDWLRFRGHGLKGHLTMAAFVLGSAAGIYYWLIR